MSQIRLPRAKETCVSSATLNLPGRGSAVPVVMKLAVNEAGVILLRSMASALDLSVFVQELPLVVVNWILVFVYDPNIH